MAYQIRQQVSVYTAKALVLLFPKKGKHTAFAFMSYQPGDVMKRLHSRNKWEENVNYQIRFKMFSCT